MLGLVRMRPFTIGLLYLVCLFGILKAQRSEVQQQYEQAKRDHEKHKADLEVHQKLLNQTKYFYPPKSLNDIKANEEHTRIWHTEKMLIISIERLEKETAEAEKALKDLDNYRIREEEELGNLARALEERSRNREDVVEFYKKQSRGKSGKGKGKGGKSGKNDKWRYGKLEKNDKQA